MQGDPVRAVVLVLAGWLGLLLAAAIAGAMPLGWVPLPDVAVLVLLFAGLHLRDSIATTCVVAAAIGYLTDLVSGAPAGVHVLVCASATLVVRGLSRRLLLSRGRLFIGGVALFAAGYGFTVVALRVLVDPNAGWGGLRRLLPSVLVTTVASPLVLRLFARVDALFARGGRGELVGRGRAPS